MEERKLVGEDSVTGVEERVVGGGVLVVCEGDAVWTGEEKEVEE